MDMSKAALPPRNGPVSEEDRKHPRFSEYQAYKSSCARLMIDCEGFKDWLRSREFRLELESWEQHPRFKEFQRWMCATKAGGRKCPEGLFPGNFQYWLKGGRW